MDEDKIRKKLHHIKATLQRAAKKSKTFEIQKLTKRIRSLKLKLEKSEGVPEHVTASRQKELDKLSNDLQAMKTADLAPISSTILYDFISTTIPSDNAQKSFLLSECQREQEHDSDEKTKKIESRISQAKDVKAALEAALVDIRKLLNIKQEKQEKGQQQNKSASTNGAKASSEKTSSSLSKKNSDSSGKKLSISAKNLADALEAHSDQSGNESSDPGDPVDDFEDSEGEEDDFDEEEYMRSFGITGDSVSEASDDDDDDDGDLSSSSEAEYNRLPRAANAKATTKSTGANSIFIDSLRGADVSDISDSDGEIESTRQVKGKPAKNGKAAKNGKPAETTKTKNTKKEEPPKKKNRPGQRARQLLWEKTYGKEAKHLILKNKLKKESTQKEIPVATPKEDEKLHPSWAAKKAQKPVIAEFVGKKIVFGEDSEDIKAVVDNSAKEVGGRKRGSETEVVAKKKPKVDYENLHPSWAAKKMQADAMASLQGKGKKIVFNDDDN
ncbi:hypothetical protein HDV05_004543 [Chytridiales sp. JEL 0842]|nr:hypothetical protein HDV05_004543 [Chytridiales sp. JEL 0842]